MSILKATFNFILLFTFLNISNLSFSQLFVDIDAGLTGVSRGSTSWGDFDNDKDLDILISGEGSGGVLITKIYINEDGNFTDLDAGLTGMKSSCVKWGDFDNDGDLDMVATGDNDLNRTIIYRNDEGTFTDINAELEYFGSFSHAAWGDFDNDGDLDLALTGSWMTELYENTGDEGFILYDSELAQLNSGRSAWGDYDNDGDLDLLLTGDTGGGMHTYLYKNTNGVFEQILTNIIGLSAGSVEWGDYDSDGDLDVLIMGFDDYVSPQALIYRNDGNNLFVDLYAGLAPVSLGKGSWADYDNDGDLDLAITGKLAGCGTFTTSVYENQGNDMFNDIMADFAVAEYSYAAWGDYDNDTDLDLLVCGSGYGTGDFTKVYRNDAALPNFYPDAPENLYAENTADGVLLSWDRGIDIQTPQDGLSYNLRIGTESEICNSLSPMSHTDDGYRKLITIGNTGLSNQILIKELEVGETYYWSVQTVDNTFAGSEFSPEQSFTITTTGLNNLNSNGFVQIYPNPASDLLFVNLNESNLDNFSLKFISLSGQQVLSSFEVNSMSNSISLDGIQSGFYFVEIWNNNSLYHRDKVLIR